MLLRFQRWLYKKPYVYQEGYWVSVDALFHWYRYHDKFGDVAFEAICKKKDCWELNVDGIVDLPDRSRDIVIERLLVWLTDIGSTKTTIVDDWKRHHN